MALRLDSRIPVILAGLDEAGLDQAGHNQARPGDVVLREGAGGPGGFTPEAGGHATGCACCAQRSPAGRALAALLQARARGEVAFFARVVAVCATPGGRAEVLAALAHDPVAASCFRLTGGAPPPS
jgi:hypothetical protein